jgi:hypothetical protein
MMNIVTSLARALLRRWLFQRRRSKPITRLAARLELPLTEISQ